MNTITHNWFLDHLEAYIAEGLSEEDRRSMESHAVVCAACEAALNEARQSDAAMRSLFAPIAPSIDFEENLLMNLRTLPAPRPLQHPAVFRAATGIAAALVLGGFGLVGNRVMKDGRFPQLSLPNISFPTLAWMSPKSRYASDGSVYVKRDQSSSMDGAESRTYEGRDLLTDVPDFDRSPDLSRLSSEGMSAKGIKTTGKPGVDIAGGESLGSGGLSGRSAGVNGKDGKIDAVNGRQGVEFYGHVNLQKHYGRTNLTADDGRDRAVSDPALLGGRPPMAEQLAEPEQLARNAQSKLDARWYDSNGDAKFGETWEIKVPAKSSPNVAGDRASGGAPGVTRFGVDSLSVTEGTVARALKPRVEPKGVMDLTDNAGERGTSGTAGPTHGQGALSSQVVGQGGVGTFSRPAEGKVAGSGVNGPISVSAGTVALPNSKSLNAHDGIAPASAEGEVALGFKQAGTENLYSYFNAADAPKAPPVQYFKPTGGADYTFAKKTETELTVAALGVKANDGEKSVKQNTEVMLKLPESAQKASELGRRTEQARGEELAKEVKENEVQKVTVTLGDTEGKPGETAQQTQAVNREMLKNGIRYADNVEPAKPAPVTGNNAPPAGGNQQPPVQPIVNPNPAQQQQTQRKIIRNGQMEFEVDSFDSSFMQIKSIVTEELGYVASTDSEKLSNGKVKGTITLRVPPDHLDVLVLKLRGLGDLKNQKIAAQDVSKQYTDLASGLRAARVMEERLLEIIKNGKGEVKDLVEAEKQLGTYRERIEQIEGELRYYDNLVSLSTLNITLFERDIKAPTAAYETEQVQAGIEVDDVEKARTDALKAIDDAKGRVIESSLKKLDAGQLTASIVAELTPESAGALTDRLKQLGRVARLEADRKQTTTGGTGAPTGLKMERKATRFNISLYNLANIAPRETVNLTLAAADVEKAYKAILNAMRGEIGDARAHTGDLTPIGRVVSSTLTRPKVDQATGALTLEVRAEQAAAFEAEIHGLGDVMNMSVTENPDANNVTRAKRGYSISLLSFAQIAPRETQTLAVAAKSVPDTYRKLLTALQNDKNPSRILASTLNELDRQNITAQVDVEVPRSAVGAIDAVLNGAESDVYSRNNARANDQQNTLDTKVRLTISLVAADRLQPRETTTIAIEVGDVERTLADAVTSAETAGGKVVERQMSKLQNGRITAHAVVDVPLTTAPATLDKLRSLGTVRVVESSKNPQVPEGPLARARFDLTLGNATPIVSAEDGVGAQFHKALQFSAEGLIFCFKLIVIGICFVGPLALVYWIGKKFFRRAKVKAVVVS